MTSSRAIDPVPPRRRRQHRGVEQQANRQTIEQIRRVEPEEAVERATGRQHPDGAGRRGHGVDLKNAIRRHRVPPLRIMLARSMSGVELRLFTTIMTLGTPQDVTLQELRIETFFPADAPSASAWTRFSGT